MAAKTQKPLPPKMARPTPKRPAGPPHVIVAAKPKPATVVAVEAPPAVPAERAFSDPVPPPPEPVVVSAPDGAVHRANCDPPSRT